MKFTIAAVLASSLATGPLASGPVVPMEPYVAPPTHVAYDWSGGYFGGTLGFGSSRHPMDPPGTLPNASGAMVGGLMGYNAQRGNVVFGGEVALNWANISGAGPCTNPAWTCTSDVSALAALRGRIGYAQDRTLVYLTGGLGAARIDHSTTVGGPVFSDSHTRTGWTLGLGVEQALNNGWRFRGQLDYYQFSGSDYLLDVPYVNERANVTTVSFSFIRRF